MKGCSVRGDFAYKSVQITPLGMICLGELVKSSIILGVWMASDL